MAEYFLNNKSLFDFGIVPSKADGNLAIKGGFDLPKRIGATYYDWKLENSVEPFVDAEDMIFGEREIRFSGTILGNVNLNISALNAYIDTLPELFPLSCKWGIWNVKLNKEIQITPINRDNSKITLSFKEPKPDLSGILPSPYGKHDVDDYSWLDFGLWLESISGGQNIGAFKRLDITQNPFYTLPSSGGHEKTEIKVKANFICTNFDDFKTKVKSLYSLLGGTGLRKIKYRGFEYTCFAVEGFTVTNIILADVVTAKFQCKLIVVDKNGIN